MTTLRAGARREALPGPAPEWWAGLEASLRSRRVWIGVLVAGLLLAMLLSAMRGAFVIPAAELFALLLGPLGLPGLAETSARAEAVLYAIRLPRVLLGAMTGATLALAGAVLQGLFRNPLADPALIGISSGAALGAALAIVFGGAALALAPAALGILLLPIAAFIGGALATLVVWRLSTREGRCDPATMILAGVAINALCGAMIGLLIHLASDAQLRSITLWSLGSLAGISWQQLALIALPLSLASLGLLRLAAPLNATLLGEREAMHLGIPLAVLRRRIILLSALLVGATVAFTGVIGFVGLVIPHIVRLAAGPDHRFLLPASMLLGAILLVLADLVARTLVAPAELPIGVLTSLLGAPFFLYLLLRHSGAGGL